tara:strand:+ start:404 stop:892 length:489 start_codon:yes stop_codon:yes gene_type:complete
MFKIKNNFFKKDKFNEMKYIVTHSNFNWYLQPNVVSSSKTTDKNIYFTHMFYDEGKVLSPFFKNIIVPFLEKLKLKTLFRCKLNLYPRTHKKIIHGFHTDRTDNHNVLLFYFNTNNGQTLFKDKKIKSVENTSVMFKGSLEHSSTTCTNQPYRITLNINYEL